MLEAETAKTMSIKARYDFKADHNVSSCVSGATVLILIIRYCIEQYLIKKEAFNASDISHFVNFVIVGVTVLVIGEERDVKMDLAQTIPHVFQLCPKACRSQSH